MHLNVTDYRNVDCYELEQTLQEHENNRIEEIHQHTAVTKSPRT